MSSTCGVDLVSRAESKGVQAYRFEAFNEFARSFMILQMLVDKHSQVFVVVSEIVGDLMFDK